MAVEGGKEMGLKFINFEDIQVLKNFKSSLTLKSAREPRGFGFIQYVEPSDAAEAKYQMDGQILLGRELTVVYAEENRKKPVDMRARERVSRSYRRSPRITRSPNYSRSRSPPPRHSSRYSRSPHRARSRSRSPIRHYSPSPSPKRGRLSRSVSPDDRRTRRERSYSQSPYAAAGSRSRTPIEDDDDAVDHDHARKISHRERSRSFSQ